MKYCIYLFLFILSGCGPEVLNRQSQSVKNESDVPAWVMSPSENAVSACAHIKDNDALTAKKVAISKAQADYLVRKSVTIVAQTNITEQVDSNVDKVNSDTNYQQNIHLQAQGEITYELQVVEEQMVHLRKYDQWCVLMMMSH